MDGLNVLGRVPWVINKDILSAAQKCWDDGIELGDIPSQQDHELPPLPIRPDGSNKEYSEAQGEFNAYREKMTKYRRMHQKNMVSLMLLNNIYVQIQMFYIY
jgi:DNA-directed RNA polymerase